MRAFLNQHSFLILAAVLLAVTALIVRRRRWGWPFLAVVAAGLGAAFLVLRTGGGDVRSPADLEAALRAGKPVAMEMYSDY
jgi:hypothetical protein